MRLRASVGPSAVAAVVMSIVLSASARAEAQGLQPPPTLSPAQQQPYQQTYPQQGGLQPPGSIPQQQQWQAPTSTQQQLTQAEKEDSGRGFEIAWANAEVGGGFISPGKDLGDGRGGLMVGVGAGVRFITWTLGARFRYMPFSDVTAWNLTGEAGFHLPMGSWDPYVNVHAGYIHLGANDAPSEYPSPHGFDLGLSIGTDYYLASMFSLGVDATADLLLLKRDEYTASVAGNALAVHLPEVSSTGVAILGSVHAGLHFDL